MRLTFPHNVVEDGRQRAHYDVNKGEVHFWIPKAESGQHFEDLDMLTRLLAVPQATALSTSHPLIEVLHAEERGKKRTREAIDDDESDVQETPVNPESIEWAHQQRLPDDHVALTRAHYGFNARYSNFFEREVEHETLHEIMDNPTPDMLDAAQRTVARISREQHDFDEDAFLADTFAPMEELSAILSFSPPPAPLPQRPESTTETPVPVAPITSSTDDLPPLEPVRVMRTPTSHLLTIMAPPEPISRSDYSETEREELMRLPRVEHLVSDEEKSVLLYGLADLLFACAYDVRTTFGEGTVESAWTIAKISATLSWCESFDSLRAALLATLRRSLVYPLYRSWKLSRAVLDDVVRVLSGPKRGILQALLYIRRQLEYSDWQHALNRLYLDDYCVWIQDVSGEELHELGKEIEQEAQRITLEDLALPIEQEEERYESAMNEERTSMHVESLSSTLTENKE